MENLKSCAAQETVNEQELMELGFKTAAANLTHKKAQARKLMIAYEHYRFVAPEVMQKFQDELKKKTYKEPKNRSSFAYPTYDTLKFRTVEEYGEVPPASVLKDLKVAKDRKCFDSFEIAKVESVEVRPDPIIFGRINGCKDYFFVSQWDNDVKIEDILGENEG